MEHYDAKVRADAVVIFCRVAYFYQEDRFIGKSDPIILPKSITCDDFGRVTFDYSNLGLENIVVQII